MIETAFAFIKAQRWAQFVLLGVAGAVAFLIWLAVHDRKVINAHDDQLDRRAGEIGNDARDDADDKQETRNEAYLETKRDLGNSGDVADYLERLRAAQDRQRSKAAGR